MLHPFDPGCFHESFLTPAEECQEADVYPPGQFRVEWGRSFTADGWTDRCRSWRGSSLTANPADPSLPLTLVSRAPDTFRPMETFIGVAVGIGLSAACGFRVFVPLLVMNLASLSGQLHLSPGFAWIGSYYATVAFATATIVEAIGYFIPALDHALDLIATPAAIIAGTVATASVVTDMSPFLKWTLALIAGGGIAGFVQGTTVALRATSSVSTAGIGNPMISTLELAGSIITALLAILVPVLCLALLGFLCIFVISKAGRSILRRMKLPS